MLSSINSENSVYAPLISNPFISDTPPHLPQCKTLPNNIACVRVRPLPRVMFTNGAIILYNYVVDRRGSGRRCNVIDRSSWVGDGTAVVEKSLSLTHAIDCRVTGYRGRAGWKFVPRRRAQLRRWRRRQQQVILLSSGRHTASSSVVVFTFRDTRSAPAHARHRLVSSPTPPASRPLTTTPLPLPRTTTDGGTGEDIPLWRACCFVFNRQLFAGPVASELPAN